MRVSNQQASRPQEGTEPFLSGVRDGDVLVDNHRHHSPLHDELIGFCFCTRPREIVLQIRLVSHTRFVKRAVPRTLSQRNELVELFAHASGKTPVEYV